MSNVPDDLRYTKTHEWVRQEEDGTVTIGITDHAQALLGDLVYVELPETGREVDVDEELAVVESVKAAADVYSPLAGEVVDVNDALNDSPELINGDCYGEGWILRMRPADAGALDGLLDAETYADVAAEEED